MPDRSEQAVSRRGVGPAMGDTPSTADRMPTDGAWPARRDAWRERVTTAEVAVQLIRSGDRIWVQQGCGTPTTLLEALTPRAAICSDVEICHMLTCGTLVYARPEIAGHFRHNGLFLGENVRASGGRGAGRLHARLPERDRAAIRGRAAH